MVIGRRGGALELGSVTWIFLGAAERLGWSADISPTASVLIMVNGLFPPQPVPRLNLTPRHDRHPFRPGHPLFVPFPPSPTRRRRFATGTYGLPDGLRAQLRSLPPFQPIPSPCPGPQRETQVRRCAYKQVLFALCMPWPCELTTPEGTPTYRER